MHKTQGDGQISFLKRILSLQYIFGKSLIHYPHSFNTLISSAIISISLYAASSASESSSSSAFAARICANAIFFSNSAIFAVLSLPFHFLFSISFSMLLRFFFQWLYTISRFSHFIFICWYCCFFCFYPCIYNFFFNLY